MKLSNKVLIGFFGFIFLYLTAVFAEVRLRGTPNIIDDANSTAETVDVSGIRYLVLEDLDKHVNVAASDQPSRLEVRSLKGDLLKRMKHRISGDTLTLSALQSKDINTLKITVFVPATGLRGMTVDNASAIVKGLKQDLLHISQKAGRVSMSDNSISHIHIHASGRSYLDISSTNVTSLSANLEDSEVYVSSPIRRLEGSMKNKSFLRVHDVGEIQFKKDNSSRLNWYQ